MHIRPITLPDYDQAIQLLQQYGDGAYVYSPVWLMQQLFVPVSAACRLLPVLKQPLPQLIVAVKEARVLGLLWLSPDGADNTRWRFEQLIVDPAESAHEVGQKLIGYAVNHFGAAGVRTFIARIESTCMPVLALFKAEGFRQAARLQHYQLAINEPRHPAAASATHSSLMLHSVEPRDAALMAEMYNAMLPVEARNSLHRTKHDFKRRWLNRIADQMSGLSYRRWLVYSPDKRRVAMGCIDLLTISTREVHLGLMILPGYENYAASLLEMAIKKILQGASRPTIHIRAFEFQKELQVAIAAQGFTWYSSTEVLIRDYWATLKPGEQEPAALNGLQGVMALFGGKASPACQQ
ncbi:MAG: hypothetical protein VKJ06_00430 [Vampirovibrionales bacterium]|nr:hypothetical protein [Vampirovibrionales bacterium]